MKTHFSKYIKQIGLFLAVLVIGSQSACKKDETSSGGTPTISRLRAISPAPNDSTLTVAGPGQMVVIQGTNLANTTAIYFNGWPATFNAALFANSSIVVTIPADMPFATLDEADLNTVKVVTTSGEAVYQFPIVPPPPVVAGITNEYAKAGSKVAVYGNNFFFVDKVVFPGNIEVTSGITANDAGTMLMVTVPSGVTTAGNIKVVNRYGTGSSLLQFNDYSTGVLHNYDNVNNYDWGAGSSSSSTDFPGNSGTYGLMNASDVNGGDFGWWNGSRSVNIKSGVWVAPANLSESLDSYALKFEISVKSPWTAGSIYIVKDYNWNYLAVYNPWKGANGTVTPFVTNGWQTVTIPLTEFRTKANDLDGTGESAPNLATLLGSSGSGGINFMFVNNGTAPVASFEAAIDNIRIIKIK